MLAPRMARGELADKHLAELHLLAARAGVPGYRLLRRDELAEQLAERGVEEAPEEAPAEEPAEVREEAPAEEPEDREPAPEEEPSGRREQGEGPTEQVSGVLDILPQRYGFLRLSGLEAAADDVYISASQIRRCELRTGDEVTGPAREPRRGERYRALVHVDLVNGSEATEEDGRPDFDALTPVAPSRRLVLEPDPADLLTRAVDLLVPLALGQRILVHAAPRSGRTTLLRGLSGAIAGAAQNLPLIVLLVDERPEEATRWREALPGAEVAAATADMGPKEQSRAADMTLARAKRRAESGDDVVLIVDSLSRLGVASGDPAAAKALFGSGRELAEQDAGSLTVIATALEGTGEDDAVLTAVATTENALVRLDPELAAAGVYPALRPGETRASDEEALREAGELEAVRRLREFLSGLEPREAADALRERLEAFRTNAKLLDAK
jgi:transcription termination factor Rho